VAECLAAFDTFVLPSVSEGMSNTLLEAMGAGVAVVASDVGGNPEIVRTGTDGLLFASNDESALKQALVTMSNEVARARFAASGRARVLSDFTIDAMISRYEALYESAVSAGPENLSTFK
jgi:glycosyltransferase involved in cell wall biosynthesis